MYIRIDFLRTSAKPCPASDRLLVSHQSFSVSFTLSDLILEHTRTVTWFWMVLILSILAVGACAVSMFPTKVEQLCFSLFFSRATMRFCVLRQPHVPAETSRTRHATLWPWPPCSFLATSCDTGQQFATIKRDHITVNNL